jgi:ABC-type antimicrobial peptide transport system permease subunit
MNNPSNENQKPLSDTVQPADTPAANPSARIAEDDQPLIQFLENTEPNKEPSEDPFFAPLPELPENVDDEEDAGEPESSESIGEDSDRSDAADDETTEPTAENTDDTSDHHSEPPSDIPANRKKIGKILGITAGSTLGLVLAVFAILLFSNFISVSISQKRREIGILRAVGARSIDVFKIFFSESFCIAAICSLISITGCAVICPLLNSSLAESLGASIFVFGILSVIIIIAIALITAVIATFLPVWTAAKKKPVDSIRSL